MTYSAVPQSSVTRFIESVVPSGTSWMDDAACRNADPEAFFVEVGDAKGAERAKAICHRCPVEDECFEYAMANQERYGIWGGQSENDRRVLRGLRPQGRRGERWAAVNVNGRAG